MSGRDVISSAIRAAAAQGEPALVAFLTAGYPSREKFREHLQAVAAGADVVEIGVPFTDPMADGRDDSALESRGPRAWREFAVDLCRAGSHAATRDARFC